MTERPNPYRTPCVSDPARYPPSLIAWCVGTVVVTSLICGVLGMTIGGLLGQFLPSYYRSSFNATGNSDFDPWAVGLGLGLTQGIMFGALIGLASFGLYYWLLSRQVRESRQADAD